MYDRGKVIVGLGVFLLLFTSPIWFNLTVGGEVQVPDLTPARALARECVAETRYMRERHMDLLNTWRNQVVRQESRFLTDPEGQPLKWPEGTPVEKSLSRTCLRCHSNYTEFCLRCHNNSRVDLTCWDCHLNFSEGVK